MSELLAKSKINLFKDQFKNEPAYFELAKLCAFPIGVTVDMVYQLWYNFKDSFNATASIPMIVVSDLVLSSLFKPVGNDIFEQEKNIRTLLLEELRQSDGGLLRLHELANFIRQYAAQRLNGNHYTSFRETLLWNADATDNPIATLNAIVQRLRESQTVDNRAEILRLRELLESFAIQEKGKDAVNSSAFYPLLQFSIALKGGFVNAPENQIQQKVKDTGFSISLEELPNSSLLRLPSNLVNKGILQVMPFKKPDTPTKKSQIWAMLVGINDYKDSFPKLQGSGNDIDAIDNFLTANYNKPDDTPVKISKLFNEQATQRGVLEQFKFIASQAATNDFIFFSFSGLDTEIPNAPISTPNGSYNSNINTQQQQTPEAPKKNIGILLLSDAKQVNEKEPEGYLRGDDLLTVVKAYPNLNFVFLLDCCKAFNFFLETPDNMISLNACSVGETAKEMQIDGKTQGVFSYEIVKKLNDNAQISYDELISAVSEATKKQVKDQTPFIQGALINTKKIFLKEEFEKEIEIDKTAIAFAFDTVGDETVFQKYLTSRAVADNWNIADLSRHFKPKDLVVAFHYSVETSDEKIELYLKAPNLFVICNEYSPALIKILEPHPNAILFFGCSEGEKSASTLYMDGKKYGMPEDKYSSAIFTGTVIEILERNVDTTMSYSGLFSEIYKTLALKTDKQRPQILAYGKADVSQPFMNGALKMIEKPVDNSNIIDVVQNLVAAAKLDEAVATFTTWAISHNSDINLINSLKLIQSQLSKNKNDEALGIISSIDALTAKSKVASDLLSLLTSNVNSSSTAPRLQIGFSEKITAEDKTQIKKTFADQGNSLFFELTDAVSGSDYLIDYENPNDLKPGYGSHRIILRTPFDDAPVFAKTNFDNLVPFFNNIDTVANWHFTLDIKSDEAQTSGDSISTDFYIVNAAAKDGADLQDSNQPIILEIGRGKNALIRLRICNNSPDPLCVTIIYLSKYFQVSDMFMRERILQPKEEVWMQEPTSNSKDISFYLSDDYFKEGRTQITEYFKVFASKYLLHTETLNRAALSFEQKPASRDIGSRSDLTIRDTSGFSNSASIVKIKTLILNLKVANSLIR